MGNIRPQLVSLLHQNTLHGSTKGKSYDCTYVDVHCIIFDSNAKSKKAMIPMDVAIEWIKSYLTEQIYPEWPAKLKISVIKENSPWSTSHHSFSSHLNAILRAYIEQYE